MGQDYQAFICYETHTALHHARNLKESLQRLKCTAFIAKDDIPTGSDEKDYRYSVIRETQKFILIMTVAGLESEEIPNEIKEALKYDKYIIPCIDAKVELDIFKKKLS